MPVGSNVIDELLIKIGADLKELDTLGQKVGAKLKSAGQSISKVGADLSRKVTLPIVAAGVAILKAAGDFETGMNKVQALTGATGDEFVMLRDQAKQLGATTQFSASQAADAMGFLGMAGFSANQIFGAMPDTLNLAAAAQLDLGQAADIVSNIMTGYGLTTDQTAMATDVLTKAFTSANTDLTQLGQAMKYAGPIAHGAGLAFADTAAALALLGNAGIQGSMAGTTLRQALNALLNPAGATQEAMARLGITVADFRDADGNIKPLVDIIRVLEASGASAGDLMQLFGTRAGPGMQALVSQGSDALANLTGKLQDSGGTAERLASVQMKGLNGAMRGLRSALEGLAIAIADSGLIDWATQLVQRMTMLFRKLANTNPEILRLGVVIAGVAAAMGPLLLVFGKLLTGTGTLISLATKVTALLGPWGVALAGLAVAGTQVYRNWDQIVAFIKRNFSPTLDSLKQTWVGLKEGISAAVTSIFEGVSLVFNDLKEFWGKWGGSITDQFSSIMGKVGDLFAAAWDLISQVVSIAFEGLKTFWALWGDDILTVFGFLWTTVGTVIAQALDDITAVFNFWASIFKGDFSGAWDAVKNLFANTWDNIKNLLANALAAMLDLMPDFIKKILNIPVAIDGVGDDIASEFNDAKEGADKMKDGVADAAKTAGDAARKITSPGGINSALDLFRGKAGSLTDMLGKQGGTSGLAPAIEGVGDASEETASHAADVTGAVIKMGSGTTLRAPQDLRSSILGVSDAVDISLRDALGNFFGDATNVFGKVQGFLGSGLKDTLVNLADTIVPGLGTAFAALVPTVSGIVDLAYSLHDLLGFSTLSERLQTEAGARIKEAAQNAKDMGVSFQEAFDKISATGLFTASGFSEDELRQLLAAVGFSVPDTQGVTGSAVMGKTVFGDTSSVLPGNVPVGMPAPALAASGGAQTIIFELDGKTIGKIAGENLGDLVRVKGVKGI